MAYCFEKKDADVGAGFRRIAAEQADKALQAASRAEEASVAEATHNVRKCCKRLRGLLRLGRYSFPDYGSENAAIRDIAARLSHLRDAEVLGQTLEQVVRAAGSDADPEAVEALRGSLADRAARLKRNLDEMSVLNNARNEMAELRERIEGWRLEHSGFKALAEGFGEVYRRGRRDVARIVDEPSAESFHDWRKQVKYHFYHLCLMRSVAPHVMTSQRDLANELGELLGSHHDMAVLLDVLAEEPALLDSSYTASFKKLLAARQAAMSARALRLGRELAAERTSCIVERVRTYWKTWKREERITLGLRDGTKIPRAA